MVAMARWAPGVVVGLGLVMLGNGCFGGIEGNNGCTNTCSFKFDGECDDGGPGSDFALCSFGTDCGDCGDRSDDSAGVGAGCTNTCYYAGDGDCDDGGSGSDFSLCPLGTDCDDCGAR